MLISQALPIQRFQAAAQAIKVSAFKNAYGDPSAEADLSVWHKLYRSCPYDARFRGIKTPTIFEA